MDFKKEFASLLDIAIKNGEKVNTLEKIFNIEFKKYKKPKKKKEICRSVLYISDSSDDE